MTPRASNITVLILLGGFILYRTIFPSNPNNSVLNTLFSLSIEVFGATLLYFLLQFLQNLNHFWLYLQTHLFFPRKDVRLSISYLFRINVNGRYLLVKNRLRNTFQPVGGAFKTLPGSEKIFGKLQVKPDRLIETENGIAKGDLRVYIPSINVIEFLKWFASKEDRETSPWREFCEELIVTQILPWKRFRYIDYKYMGTVQSPIIKLDSGGKGIFIFEVYDLVINNEHMEVLLELQEKGDDEKHIWVDDYLIQRLGHDESTKKYKYEISPQTKYAQNLKWA